MLPLCISAGGSICRTIKLRKASLRHISAADVLKFSRRSENAADILKIQSASWEMAAGRRRGMRCNRPMICPESSTVSRE